MWLCHSDDDFALFASDVNVPVSFDNVFQGIASIDDQVDLPRLNQLCEDQYIFRLFACYFSWKSIALEPSVTAQDSLTDNVHWALAIVDCG